MSTATQCPECGARYVSDSESCITRFDQLLALDHSRREPWGSRHGQAFAAFVLQHPLRFSASVDSAWAALWRIYCLNHPPGRVFDTIRAAAGRAVMDSAVPSKPPAPARLSTMTIADLGDFPAAEYPSLLDAWCRATLRAWGAPVDMSAA